MLTITKKLVKKNNVSGVTATDSTPRPQLGRLLFNPKDRGNYAGEVNIGKKVFIGVNTIIVNAVNIGDYAVIGAGTVVNRDIPAGEIWTGNPAKFIKKAPVFPESCSYHDTSSNPPD